MGITINIGDTTFGIGRKYFDPENAELCSWKKVELCGPISTDETSKIRASLLATFDEDTFIYREIFYCCTAWFKNEEDAVWFKTTFGGDA